MMQTDLVTLSHDLVRRADRWTFVLTVTTCIVLGVWQGWELALGIALGALLAALNLRMLAGAVARFLQPSGARRSSLLSWLRWPILALALAGILWYMPARPEGVAIGIVLSLVAACVAAVPRRRETAQSDDRL